MESAWRVAVILVNHKKYAQTHLPECYRSLCAQTFPRERMALFIADNESTDQTHGELARIAPEARILPSTENLGWAGGNNAALRAALAEGFDYFVLLNMDTRVEPDWLAQLVRTAQERTDLQILQSKILIHGTDRVNSLGNRIQFLGYGYCNGYGQPDSDPRRYPVDFASGAAMGVRREVFEKIGLFQENYFMYCEDTEFCWRARLAGFRVGLAERSICHHKYNLQHVVNAIDYVERNRLLTLLTLEKVGTILLTLPALIPLQIGSILYFTLQGRGRAMGRTIRYFLNWRTWVGIACRRRQIRALRVVNDGPIVKGFAGGIVFAEYHSTTFRFLINPLLRVYWALAKRLILW